MKTRVFTIFFAGAVLGAGIVLSSGCKKVAARSPDAGGVSGQVYSNAFFRFSLAVPAGWSVAPPDGSGTTDGSSGTRQLLLISREPMGAKADSNPTLLVVAEQASSSAGTTAREYLQYVRRILAESIIRQGDVITPYTPVGNIEERALGGRPGGRASFTVQIGGRQARQTYFTTVIEGYALSVIISALNDDDFRQLEAIVNSARFAQR